MTGKKIAVRIIFALAFPLVFLGLIDPLEGGLALIAAGVLYLVGFLLVRQRPAPSLWIPYALSLFIGIAVILFATVWRVQGPYQPLDVSVLVGLWLYRVTTLITLVGAVLNAFRYLTNRR